MKQALPLIEDKVCLMKPVSTFMITFVIDIDWWWFDSSNEMI